MGDGEDVADCALLDQERGDAPRRRPATVLVHSDPHAAFVGFVRDSQGGAEVQGERLLRENVLARDDRPADHLRPNVRAGRHVHDLDLLVGQQLVQALKHTSDEREAVADAVGRFGNRIVDAHDVHAVLGVSGQMPAPRDVPAPDQAETRLVPGREGRTVVESALGFC
jgi:hypothetical protein